MRREVLVSLIERLVVLVASFLSLVLLIYIYVNFVVMKPAFFSRYLFCEQYCLSNKIDVSKHDTERVLSKLFAYVKGKSESPIVVVKIGDDRVLFYNARELSHLQDVRELFDNIHTLIVVAGFYEIIVIVFMTIRKNYKLYARLFCFSEIIQVIMISVVLLISRKNTVLFIALLHKILFDNDRWILNDVTDRLVLLFPQSVYEAIMLNFFVFWFFVTNVFRIIVYLQYRRKKNGAV